MLTPECQVPYRPVSSGGIILTSLILVAAVANLNLSVANVALPSIGRAFDASQTSLNLVAVGYALGLAASVLWLGALGDRYWRKMMLITGTVLAIPASLLVFFMFPKMDEEKKLLAEYHAEDMGVAAREGGLMPIVRRGV
jgi:DHA2 family multidrug resistance protein-like MFS transporter